MASIRGGLALGFVFALVAWSAPSADPSVDNCNPDTTPPDITCSVVEVTDSAPPTRRPPRRTEAGPRPRTGEAPPKSERARPLHIFGPESRSGGSGDSLGCANPCTIPWDGAELTNPYYDVVVDCDDGNFAARTSDEHPDGPELNVIFGGAELDPNTSDVAWHEFSTNTTYLNPTGGQACSFDPPDTALQPDSIGIEQEWLRSPALGMDLTLRQEVVAFGSTPQNSGVRLSLCATNEPSSSRDAIMGVRWQIDYENGGDDGPSFAWVSCDPFNVEPETFLSTEFDPAEFRDFYRTQNNTGTPIFGNYTNTKPIGGISNTGSPDRLFYGSWPTLRSCPWIVNPREGEVVDADSAVLYYFGYLAGDAVTLRPGESFCRSVVLFTRSHLLNCSNYEATSLTVCPEAQVTLGATAWDECSTPTVSLREVPPGPPCLSNPCTVTYMNPGVYEYLWQAEDDAGNSSLCSTVVEVLEHEHPDCEQPPVCDVAALTPRTGLKAVKIPAEAARFEWEPDPLALEYHLNSVTRSELLTPPGPHLGESGVLECSSPDPICSDPDPFSNPAGILFYQALSACGPDEEGPVN